MPEDIPRGQSEYELSNLEWARNEIERSNWLKANAASLGLEPQVGVGHVLSTFLNDDGGIFAGPKYFEGTPQETEVIKSIRLPLLERLRWESEYEGLSETIKLEFSNLRNFMESNSLESRKQLNEARNRYRETGGVIRKEVNQDLGLSQAYELYNDNINIIQQAYTQSKGK